VLPSWRNSAPLTSIDSRPRLTVARRSSTPNNTLTLRAISQPNNPDPARRYTSARLVSHQSLSRSQGSLTAVLSLPCAGGIWPAFWLLPREPFTWPTDGEVDIAETWNGDAVNHSCLHWGFYTPQDTQKHRVRGTPVQGMQSGRPVRFEFAWMQDPHSKQGRMMWWIDGAPVMKAPIPLDMNRRMEDFVVLLNVAMGGNVCQGVLPREGAYDFVVWEMKMQDQPDGGWTRFERDYANTREGDVI
jgi:beta-glucanase (GH16 family)